MPPPTQSKLRQQSLDLVQHIKEAILQGDSKKQIEGFLQKEGGELRIKGQEDQALFISILALNSSSQTLLVITPTIIEAETLSLDLERLAIDSLVFPPWETVLYQGISSRTSTFSLRAQSLAEILLKKTKIVICTIESCTRTLVPTEHIQENILHIKKGGLLSLELLEEHLANMGYLRVARVSVPGEFAVRGELLDFYPFNSSESLRVLFNFDEVEAIKKFDPISQISNREIDEFSIYPLKELRWNTSNIKQLELRLQAEYVADLGLEKCQQIIQELQMKKELLGEELLYSLAFEQPVSIIDYLPDDSLIVLAGEESLKNRIGSLELEFRALDQRTSSFIKPKIERFLPDLAMIREQAPKLCTISEWDNRALGLACQAIEQYQGNIQRLKADLEQYITDSYQVHIFAGSAAQAQRISYMFRKIDIVMHERELSASFVFAKNKIVCIQETDIFNRRYNRNFRKREARTKAQYKTQVLDSFVELEPGDHVVHIQHGIGRFIEIKRMIINNMERDYISLEYAGDNGLFVPIEQIDMLQRYIGSRGENPKLDSIGTKAWQKRKDRTKKLVEDLADNLLRLYARRNQAEGFAFTGDDELQNEFEADFPFTETDDQLKAVAEIKADMELARPMDRLLCGDVGFGKTEVAMRACFKAVSSNKQAAVLCPTTILAEQHFLSFQKRFARFPIKIAMLSRFVSRKNQQEVIKQALAGTIDILIGTHRLLSKDIHFNNLGLMIVDEEQRFGVKHKEALKQLKTSLDCLSLSATPIPRTLHMSLVKIRNMSLLETPPMNRQPIETFIQEFKPETVEQAIRHEIERDGQVFYLHNRVQSLEEIQIFIRSIVPEALVEIAHGQMNSEDLEDIMRRFIQGAFQVLVATTIIENGIDIPNVNTIIIDRADQYGISQLYQLRGRVGRSGRLAYAYLLYPHGQALAELAMKRLRIISDFTELGSGFKIAMKDMEVRGAGNLLGAEQSGTIMAVGFDMYLRLLSEALAERSPEHSLEQKTNIYLELEYSGYIPDSYVHDVTEKMEIYKRISAVDEDEQLLTLHEEIHDRFGSPPVEVNSLLALADIRCICRKLDIKSLRERQGRVEIVLNKVAKIAIAKVLKLMKTNENQISLDSKRANVLFINTKKQIELVEKAEYIRNILSQLYDGA